MKQALTDQYGSFTEMAENEIEGTDYSVAARDAGSALLVMAPHGGGIEPGISEIVRAFAAGSSVYLLEGLKRRGNKSLHVTSAHFDCPLAVRMAAGHRYILAFHGYDEPFRRHTLIGGQIEGAPCCLRRHWRSTDFLRSWRLKGDIFQVQTLQASTIAAKQG